MILALLARDVRAPLSLRRRLGRAVGVPEPLALLAPAPWLAVALGARVAGLERIEAFAVGRFLRPAIRAARSKTLCAR
jgi:hypothetical protein